MYNKFSELYTFIDEDNYEDQVFCQQKPLFINQIKLYWQYFGKIDSTNW